MPLWKDLMLGLLGSFSWHLLTSFLGQLARQFSHANILEDLQKQILTFHDAQQTSLGDMHHRIQIATSDVKAIIGEHLPTAASSSQARPRDATAVDFINVLQVVARAIPVPAVSSVVEMAALAIKVSETPKLAKELQLRIQTLVTFLVNELKGKQAGEIGEKYLENMTALGSDLKFIHKILEEITSQRPFQLLLSANTHQEKVRACEHRLNVAIERFNLARHFYHADILGQLEKQIRTFHANRQKSLRGIQNQIQLTMGDIEAVLGEDLPTASVHLRSRAIPAITNTSHGQAGHITDLVRILTKDSEGQKGPRVCLLGPGSIGHTSLALSVITHPDVKKHYPGGNRVWVPCATSTSSSLFIDALHSSLGIAESRGGHMYDVLENLEAPRRVILLLNDFQTASSIDEGQKFETEEFLNRIDEISHISLFITTRSLRPPCSDTIQWHSVDLRTVDSAPARQIYPDIYTEGANGPNFEQGSDREQSKKRSGVGLSINSLIMKEHPEALELLATLAMLPAGTNYDMLMKWWAPNSSNLKTSVEVLQKLSLVEQQDSNLYIPRPTLSALRGFFLDPSLSPKTLHTSLVESACNFLAEYSSPPDEALYNFDHATTPSAIEQENLRAILLKTTKPAPNLINALITLAQHQELTSPRTDIIQHALDLVHGMEDNSRLLAAVSFSYGNICIRLDRFTDAREHYTLAHDIFLSIPDKKKAAECLLKLVQAYASDKPWYARDRALIADAQTKFESINDRRGIALCHFHLGRFQWKYASSHSSYSEVVDLFRKAKGAFARYKDAEEHAECSLYIAHAYFWMKDYEQAQIWAASAVEEYGSIRRYQVSATHIHARVHIVKGDYDSALSLLVHALEHSKLYGTPLDTALMLEQIGRIWSRVDRTIDAKVAFQRCVRIYSSAGKSGQLGAVRCNFFIRRLDLQDPLSSPSDDEVSAVSAQYPEGMEGIL
ncbi:hypothetical protein FPV67DRAFT_267325 [Lyophyllum atratum]|nr:hypothetical protein FPV67DRAFT_267325 [Lyophyllum atratum]